MTPLVVVSHYNRWPADQLIALLDQIAEVPAGMPFALCVVVNQALPERLELPERHRAVPVLYRENTGYNIGAWELGWRANPDHDCYLFLQEECRIVRRDWLRSHYRLAMQPRVGVVGESLHWAGLSWKRLRRQYRDFPFDEPVDGKRVPYPVGVQAVLRAAGVPEGATGAHLQALVLCLRKEVLEAIGGFAIGDSYAEAVMAEVAISKRAEALGLAVREVGPGSFRYILHPQWARRQGVARAVARRAMRYVPAELVERIRALIKKRSAT